MTLNNEIYISQQEHFDSLNSDDKLVFLDYLFDSFTSSKANIYHRFLQANPFMENYILEHKLEEYHLKLLDTNPVILHSIMNTPQNMLPNIIFYSNKIYHVILREPFFSNHEDIESKIKELYGDVKVELYIASQEFLSMIDLSLNLQKCFMGEDLDDSFIDDIFVFASLFNASDIHLSIDDDKCGFSMRLNGALISFCELNAILFAKLSKKLRLLSSIDINPKIPQDGHIRGADEKDIRMSFLPTHSGESIVLRIPHADSSYFLLESMNIKDEILAQIKHLLLYKSGLILISGPTGSAKSTLLYNCLAHLNNSERKIITIEDPIERNISGITQCEANIDLGLDFGEMLKYVLRQDPDVIMVGEIRDFTTLEISIRAALTGHLVLSSIHSKDCESSIARLLDLGAKEYLLRASLRSVISQRLLKTLCPACKVYGDDGMPFCEGCGFCYNRGYGPRILIQEILDFRDEDRSKSLLDFAKNHARFPLEHEMTRLYKEGIISYEESLL